MEIPAAGMIPVWLAIPIAGALVSVVVLLWNLYSGNINTRINELTSQGQHNMKKLEKCEEEHKASAEQFVQINRKVGELEGFQRGIETQNAAVLAELRRALGKEK